MLRNPQEAVDFYAVHCTSRDITYFKNVTAIE